MGEWRFSSTILNLALDGGEWSASRLWRCTSRETARGIHYIGGWVDPEPIGTYGEEKHLCPYRESNTDS
jgi:hypothetical protein